MIILSIRAPLLDIYIYEMFVRWFVSNVSGPFFQMNFSLRIFHILLLFQSTVSTEQCTDSDEMSVFYLRIFAQFVHFQSYFWNRRCRCRCRCVSSVEIRFFLLHSFVNFIFIPALRRSRQHNVKRAHTHTHTPNTPFAANAGCQQRENNEMSNKRTNYCVQKRDKNGRCDAYRWGERQRRKIKIGKYFFSFFIYAIPSHVRLLVICVRRTLFPKSQDSVSIWCVICFRFMCLLPD